MQRCTRRQTLQYVMEALCFPHLPNNSDTPQNGDEALFSSFGAINSTCDATVMDLRSVLFLTR